MTPAYSCNSINRSCIFYYYPFSGVMQYGLNATQEAAIHPVINLKSDVKVLRGNGTKNNPYVIAK